MSTYPVPHISQIFNQRSQGGAVETIADIVKDFKMKAEQRATCDCEKYFLMTKLAPSFGTLDAASIKNIDEEVKIMLATMHMALAKTPLHERSADKMVEICVNNLPLFEMEMDPALYVDRTAYITKPMEFFNFAKHKNMSVINETYAWFTSAVLDADIINSTQIDIGVFSEIMVTMGAVMQCFQHDVKKNEILEKKIVDIGVLRYPDIENPYLKVYRIRLTAWCDTTHVLVGRPPNGITGTCNMRCFSPILNKIASLQAITIDKLLAEADVMFD
ncbi:hypothetical protein A0H81_10521 [Grifola frondosa]|uniref:Uncharacterized protein n=1 Tax=Grifola frondosa TaxID=5627 RepID=A0A1C7LZ06_GRIFR|nr:hypothetical protein A0H81_10521 [Grifola frondosa]